MNSRLAVFGALVFLSALMVISFLGQPWNPTSVSISNQRVAEALFQGYTMSLVVIALLLAAAMVGGVFLARREEGP